MSKQFLLIVISLISFKYVIAQSFSAGFAYGKNLTYTYPITEVITSDEIKLFTTPSNAFSFTAQYNFYKNNWLGLEARVVERHTSYHYYIMAGGYLMDGNYNLKDWELLLKYNQYLFAVKNKLFFNFHLLCGFAEPIEYQFLEYNPSDNTYNNVEPRHKYGILIGYGITISYSAFKNKITFFASSSLTHLNIKYLYGIEFNAGILYNLNFNKKGENQK